MPKQIELEETKAKQALLRKTRDGGQFTTAYERLNGQQRQAVDTIEGPLMVVAGPGTGKTQVIALRVANILRKTHMRPSNILCLTFSTSGAVAMRERLRELIGADAYGVTVKNFHSFCNDLIAEYPLVFDGWSALEQISDVERYRELNKIIDQLLPSCELVNRKNPYRRTGAILGRISQLKREGKTDLADLQQIADDYEEQLSNQSKEGTKAHEKNLLTARKFRDLIAVFEKYQAMLESTQRYDYDDMILYVLKALREEDWLLQSLQERYQYILVDEFQDTNGAQYQLVEALTSYASVDHQPNLCTVGDDDQAIYRFQGANLANILAFHQRFPEMPVIALTTSYRCAQPILDAASHLISHNTERLVGRVDGLSKDLSSHVETCDSHVSTNTPTNPSLLLSPSDLTEPWMIADTVAERIADGIAPQEIAILVQTNAELEALYDVLVAREIPVQMSGKVDLLNHDHVQQLLAILRAVHQPNDNAACAAALGCACFGIHPADLGRLYLANREFDGSLMSLLLEEQNNEQIICTRDIILDLHHKLSSRTVVDTVEQTLKTTGLLPNFTDDDQAAKKPADPLDFVALQEFFERLKYRAYEQPDFSFETFLSDLEYYEKAEYGELRLRYDVPHLTEAGVQLMTAHQSKGLEFDVVIMPNLRLGHWDKRRNPPSISMPEDLLFGWEKDQKTYERAQDERRVAYVAMTRARHELIFTCPKQLTTGDRTRDVSPSAFIAEAGDIPETVVELAEPERTSTLLFDPLIITDEAFRAFLKQRLENFALSVTALNHYLEDPQIFIEIDLLQTPQAKEPSLVYGNAVHDALRQWGLSVQQGEPLDQAGFLAAFSTYLDEREILTTAERERLRTLGQQALPRYYEQRLSEGRPVIHRVECPVNTHLDDVPIKGKIDRIDLLAVNQSDARIIDFKTGQPKTENQILDGDYFRQLAFYALLMEHGMPILTPQEYVLDFVGEGSAHPVERSFTVSQEQKTELAQVVKQVWAKIQALDFTPIE